LGRTDSPPLVVLEDDPTGAQLLENARVVIDPVADDLARAADDGARSVHVLTNARALDPAGARDVTCRAARTARSAFPDARVISRGDSTLRGHVAEEYLGLAEGALAQPRPPLLLAMALPSAGRVIRGGVAHLIRDGRAQPLHDTEYARDPALAYGSARLIEWADERSAGMLQSVDGIEVGLEELRGEGSQAVARALAGLLAYNAPAVCAPDAETHADLRLIAEGLEQIDPDGRRVAVRCGPAFSGVLAGNLAAARRPVPAARRTLVLCGSWVPTTTRQLAALAEVPGGDPIMADVGALAGPDWRGELDRLRRIAGRRLEAGGLAVLTTPRTFDQRLADSACRERVARRLARVIDGLDPVPELVVAKGGVTSAVTLPEGLGARAADVIGPVEDGVSWWQPLEPAAPALLVVPGNVGDDDLLRRIVVAAARRESAGAPS